MPAGSRAQLRPIGIIRSTLKVRTGAPRQGREGAPDAWLEVHPGFTDALEGLAAGDDFSVLTRTAMRPGRRTSFSLCGPHGGPSRAKRGRRRCQPAKGLRGMPRAELLGWFHRARRETMLVYPRSNRRLTLTGVFATRSPDRPNPIGLHPVTIKRITGTRLRIGPIEAIDGTPVIDIKPRI